MQAWSALAVVNASLAMTFGTAVMLEILLYRRLGFQMSRVLFALMITNSLGAVGNVQETLIEHNCYTVWMSSIYAMFILEALLIIVLHWMFSRHISTIPVRWEAGAYAVSTAVAVVYYSITTPVCVVFLESETAFDDLRIWGDIAEIVVGMLLCALWLALVVRVRQMRRHWTTVEMAVDPQACSHVEAAVKGKLIEVEQTIYRTTFLPMVSYFVLTAFQIFILIAISAARLRDGPGSPAIPPLHWLYGFRYVVYPLAYFRDTEHLDSFKPANLRTQIGRLLRPKTGIRFSGSNSISLTTPYTLMEEGEEKGEAEKGEEEETGAGAGAGAAGGGTGRKGSFVPKDLLRGKPLDEEEEDGVIEEHVIRCIGGGLGQGWRHIK
jgi:hypothetical protein